MSFLRDMWLICLLGLTLIGFNHFRSYHYSACFERQGALTILLPYCNAMLQTQAMTPHPFTVYSANRLLCYPLIWNATLRTTTSQFNICGLTTQRNPFPDPLEMKRTLYFNPIAMTFSEKLRKRVLWYANPIHSLFLTEENSNIYLLTLGWAICDKPPQVDWCFPLTRKGIFLHELQSRQQNTNSLIIYTKIYTLKTTSISYKWRTLMMTKLSYLWDLVQWYPRSIYLSFSGSFLWINLTQYVWTKQTCTCATPVHILLVRWIMKWIVSPLFSYLQCCSKSAIQAITNSLHSINNGYSFIIVRKFIDNTKSL